MVLILKMMHGNCLSSVCFLTDFTQNQEYLFWHFLKHYCTVDFTTHRLYNIKWTLLFKCITHSRLYSITYWYLKSWHFDDLINTFTRNNRIMCSRCSTDEFLSYGSGNSVSVLCDRYIQFLYASQFCTKEIN
jgi:hypothetical protein